MSSPASSSPSPSTPRGPHHPASGTVSPGPSPPRKRKGVQTAGLNAKPRPQSPLAAGTSSSQAFILNRMRKLRPSAKHKQLSGRLSSAASAISHSLASPHLTGASAPAGSNAATSQSRDKTGSGGKKRNKGSEEARGKKRQKSNEGKIIKQKRTSRTSSPVPDPILSSEPSSDSDSPPSSDSSESEAEAESEPQSEAEEQSEQEESDKERIGESDTESETDNNEEQEGIISKKWSNVYQAFLKSTTSFKFLDTSESYSSWTIRFTAHLSSLQLRSVIESEPPPSPVKRKSKAQTEQTDKQKVVYLMMIPCVPEDLLVTITHALPRHTGYHAWKAIREHYIGNESLFLERLEREFSGFVWMQHETFLAFEVRFTALTSQLAINSPNKQPKDESTRMTTFLRAIELSGRTDANGQFLHTRFAVLRMLNTAAKGGWAKLLSELRAEAHKVEAEFKQKQANNQRKKREHAGDIQDVSAINHGAPSGVPRRPFPARGPAAGSGPPGLKRYPCRNFANLGQCKFGAACKFAHTTGQNYGNNGSAQPPPVPRFPPASRSPSSAPCFDFARGRCHRGAACRYSHATALPGAPGPQQPRQQPFNANQISGEHNNTQQQQQQQHQHHGMDERGGGEFYMGGRDLCTIELTLPVNYNSSSTLSAASVSSPSAAAAATAAGHRVLLDSGAGIHITPHRHLLSDIAPLAEDVLIRAAFGKTLRATHGGVLRLRFGAHPQAELVVDNVILCEDEQLRDTLLSLIQLSKQGHNINLHTNMFSDRSGRFTLPLSTHNNVLSFLYPVRLPSVAHASPESSSAAAPA